MKWITPKNIKVDRVACPWLIRRFVDFQAQRVAVVLLLLRESLVEMDVPTRQSYVAAVVRPDERTFASGVTNLTRNAFWAGASSLAGFLMQHVAFGAPLVIGGGLKVVYDALLYGSFRKVKPPEEVVA